MIKAGVICGSSGTQGAWPFLQDCFRQGMLEGSHFWSHRGLEQKGPRDPPPPPSSCPEHSKLPSSSPGLAREDMEMEMAQPLQMHHIPFSQGKFSRAQLALSLPPLVTIASRPVDPIDSSQATNTRAQEIKSPASLKRKPSNKRLN